MMLMMEHVLLDCNVEVLAVFVCACCAFSALLHVMTSVCSSVSCLSSSVLCAVAADVMRLVVHCCLQDRLRC